MCGPPSEKCRVCGYSDGLHSGFCRRLSERELEAERKKHLEDIEILNQNARTK